MAGIIYCWECYCLHDEYECIEKPKEKEMNWYYAEYDCGHTTEVRQFKNDEDAIKFYFSMKTMKNGIEFIYNCGRFNDHEHTIWSN